MNPLASLWRRERLRAILRIAAWYGAPVAVALTWLDWLAFWALVRAAAAPARPLTWFAIVPAVCGAAIATHLGIRRLLRAPANEATLAVLDQVRRGDGDPATIRRFWDDRFQQARGDAWRYGMFWAILGSLMLNTWSAWGPLATAAVTGRDVRLIHEVESPLVEIAELRVFSPITDAVREMHESDGFLRVDEGARVEWAVEPLRPADVVELEFPDGTQRDAGAAPQLFATVLSQPVLYRFAIQRYDVRFVEARPRRIDVRPDLPPEVAWIEPPPSVLDERRQIEVAIRSRDDRAVTAVALEVRTDSGRVLLFDAPHPGTTTRLAIDPAELPPSEAWQFTGIAWDNDRFPGPNVGRSDTITVRRRSVEQEHDAYTDSLVSWLKRQVRYLGGLLDHGADDAWWMASLERLRDEATALAETGRALEEVVETLPLRSADAVDTVVRIARRYERLFEGGWQPESVIEQVEEAAFETDELIGLEQAARAEYQQQQVYSRLESMSQRISDATDAELTRMLEALQREMEQLAKDMRDKRPQMPAELLQKDAFRAEKSSEQSDLMQQIRDAIARGDRERAKELMQQLLELMRKAREEVASAAGSRSQADDRVGAALEKASQELQRLAHVQRKLSERLEQVESQLQRQSRELMRQLESGRQDGARRQQARERLQQALEQGDERAVEDALQQLGKAEDEAIREALEGYRESADVARKLAAEQARLRQQTGQVGKELESAAGGPPQVLDELEQAQYEMQAAEGAATRGQVAEARQRGWQALGHLERAAERLAEKQQQRRRLAEQPSFSDPLAQEGEGDEHRGDESFDTPEGKTDPRAVREEVLRSFRRGVPGPARDINERYLDRLLH